MNKQTLIGLGVLLGIVFVRWLAGQFKSWRIQRFWVRGLEAIKAGDMVAAEVAMRKCVAMAPIYAPAHRVMGRVLAARKKFKEAEKHFKAGAELEPRNPQGFMDLGMYLALSGPERADEAIEAFSKAVACSPEMRATLRDEPRLAGLRKYEGFRELVEPRREA